MEEGVHAPQISVPPVPAQITVRSLNASCIHAYCGGESTAPVAEILRSASNLPMSPASYSRARTRKRGTCTYAEGECRVPELRR